MATLGGKISIKVINLPQRHMQIPQWACSSNCSQTLSRFHTSGVYIQCKVTQLHPVLFKFPSIIFDSHYISKVGPRALMDCHPSPGGRRHTLQLPNDVPVF